MLAAGTELSLLSGSVLLIVFEYLYTRSLPTAFAVSRTFKIMHSIHWKGGSFVLVISLKQILPCVSSRELGSLKNGGSYSLVIDMRYCNAWNVAATDGSCWRNELKSLGYPKLRFKS